MIRSFIAGGMRWRLVLVGLMALPALTCVQPPERLTPETEPFDLTISVSRPAEDVVFSDDELPVIRWSDLGPNDLDGDGRFNDPPDGSTVLIQLDPDPNDPGSGNEIDVLGPVDAVPDDDMYEFDGLDADGEIVEAGTYYVVGTMDTGSGDTLTDISIGTIRVPLAFSEPEVDVELAVVDDSTTIVWTADDGGIAGGTVDLGLDPDPVDHTDGGAGEDEDEKYFLQGRPLADGDFELSGAVIGSAGIADGTYYLFARIEQPGFDTMYITSPVQITIGSFGPPTLEFVGLDDDIEAIVGDTVTIEWDDEDPDDDAKIDLFVIDDVTGVEEQLLNDQPEDPDGSQDEFNWDTTGMRPAVYRVKATISDDTSTVEVVADGKIILRSCTNCPLITITSPSADVDGNTMNRIRIRWQDDTPADGAKVALYYDDDSTPMETGEPDADEQRITPAGGEDGYPDGTEPDSFEWVLRPEDLTEAAVPAGTYWIFGYIGQSGVPEPPSTNIDGYSVAAGKVDVDNTQPQLEFTTPGDTDETLIIGDDGEDDLLIRWNSRDADDPITIELFIDLDSNHDNGNERPINDVTINAAAGPQTGSFAWTNDGVTIEDASGAPVSPGEYTLFAVIDDGVAAPVTAEAEGKIIVQSGSGSQPQITMVDPLADVPATVGTPIDISWQADNTTAGTKIQLRYDDDPMPDQVTETGEDEVDIDGLRDAASSSGEYSWNWHPDPGVSPANILLPAVPEGEYYVFGYIGGADPVANPSSIDVATGRILVPNTSPELVFTTPASGQSVTAPAGIGRVLAFDHRDPDESIRIKLFLDPDTNHNNGNEVRIDNGDINPGPQADGSGASHSESWDGTDIASQQVETGTYFLYAKVNDDSNPEVTVEAGANRKVHVVPADAVSSGAAADVANNAGAGPFTLTDGGADFVGDGVTTGAVVQITGGTGAIVGVYDVTAVTAIVLTLDRDAGDSAGAGDVAYSVFPRTAAVIVMATPASNQAVNEGDDVAVTWADLTATGSETITLVYSTSSTADAGAEVGAAETLIRSGIQAALDGVNDQATWDTSGVATGTYFIHGKILAGATVKDTSTAKGSVEVTGAAVTPSLEFLQPVVPVDGAVGAAGAGDNDLLDVVWLYESGANGTISLFVDRDTTNTNGNERVILSNRPQAAAPGSSTDSLTWNLTDSGGTDVPTGKYFMRGVLNVSGSSAMYATADGLVNIRKTANSPLIQLTAPTTTVSVKTTLSRQVPITWDTDDPVGGAEVHLWYSTTARADDDTIRTAKTAAGGPITPITGVPASDGAFTWFINPGDLDVDTYYIHAVIGSGGDFNNDDDRDTALGQVDVTEP